MKKNLIWWILAGLAIMGLSLVNWKSVLSGFLKAWEGFSSSPYWDVSRWSWGYGTRVPGSVNNRSQRPSGSITQAKAMTDAISFSNTQFNELAPLVTVKLNSKQWAAFLSFAYNLGTDDAKKLLPNLNSQNWDALGEEWNRYVYAGGVRSTELEDRRAAEWQLFNS